MNKKKEDNTSAEASDKQKKKGRLDGMLEAMNKRSDPLTTHKVATEYFSSFRSERNITIPQISEQIQPVNDNTTAVSTEVDTSVTTPVTTAVIADPTDLTKSTSNSLDATHTSSENKVYNVIKQQLINSGSEEIRIGLTKLKELTRLSDKTIRVAIKSLENKQSIIIKDGSKGIYGRKYFLPNPPDVIKKRLELEIQIDTVSKHVLPR
jgi:hypothetical protein